MKKTLLFTLFAAAISFTSCNEDESLNAAPEVPQQPEFIITRATFPEDDGSPKASGTLSTIAARLLLNADVEFCTDTVGRMDITDAEFTEIKQFTDKLVVDCKNDYDRYVTCFNWVYNNVKYGHEYPEGGYVDNNPYPVFNLRYAVCQGYANLLFTMLRSQNVPVLVANGYLDPLGGHAWNYVYCGDKGWYVSDPTNSGSFKIKMFGSYAYLMPYSIDAILYTEQGCSFNYSECNLNVCAVENTTYSEFVVPFSVRGYRVTSFNPSIQLPSNIKEIYLGKNIETLGEQLIGLNLYAPNVERVNIDPANPYLASYLGAVYRKNGSDYQLYCIPSAMTCLELMPMETIYKNTVYCCEKLEVAIIAPGTKTIEPWAFEQCPNLRIAYVPEDVEIEENAFADVHPDFQIVRGDFTNIPEVRE
ncbi:MAG: leucine-rich repeat protein [Bacteroidaceae bacterium]|nr:leucine-rich repeat protein [Bacteroidaceae bacterium]